ncbi:MAG: DUF4038 domain-containing protein [Phycisphaerae bacterium]|nr:DUF4038 domain-containing protein [Phycisphaerae bacterium]
MEMKRLSRVILGLICCLAAIGPDASAKRMKPLSVSDNGHFLIEQGGKPFFVLADTAWPLFSGLSREDVKFYLDDRKAKGFNTILCSLLHFGPNGQPEWTPKHRVYGFWAFDGNHFDWSRPNKQYWKHVDWVIQQARERSLRLAIVPCRFRSAGGAWKQSLTGAAVARFGEYLGLRCCNYNNIIWLFGGDYPPMQNTRHLRLLAEGIRYYAPHHLISHHAAGPSSNRAFGNNERWPAFNSIRTQGEEHPGEYTLVQKDWRRAPAKPTWLAEPHYERPNSRFAIRQAAWRSVLSGGAGFGYGVNNMFNLGNGSKWKEMLNMPGGSDVLRMLDLLKSQPWHKLVPDHAAKDKLLAAVEADADVHIASACSADGDFGVIYLPVRATIAVDMGKFKSNVIGRWFSPTSAYSAEADGSPFINAGIHTIRPPDSNSLAESDLILVLTASSAAEPRSDNTTILAIDEDKFTVNGKRTFLFGISYYGALGAQPEFVTSDFDDMQKLGINWIRLWATWGAFGNDVTAVDEQRRAREPYMSRLKKLVAECDQRGMIVDVTLSRGNGITGGPRLQSLEVHKRAVETVVTELKNHRNWYLDLGNERNITDKRHVSMAELRELRNAVRQIDKDRLVTASRAGDIPKLELREYIKRVGVDFISPHRPRSSKSARQTKNKSHEYITWMKEIGSVVPLHYQEPFRRGFTRGWEPTVEDFVTDAKGAAEGGAAGWCLHNGDQKDRPGSKPRRSFDMRRQRLFDQLDDVEKEALERISKFLQAR